MTVAPLIAMKSSQVKSFDAVGRELDRRAHTYANDIDGSGRHIGYRCRAEDERPVPLERALGAMQDRFYGCVGALYGLSRGEKRLEGQPARRHKSVAEYKAESRRVQAELDEKAEQLETARAELASTRAQLAECRSQVEGFAARFERIKAELAQIAECLSVRGFLGSFKAKLAEFAENPICKAALAAGRAFETARDGRRAEKVLVNGAREKVAEMDELSREMDEWSLLDEVGDMRGARRELDGREAPARALDNQVL